MDTTQTPFKLAEEEKQKANPIAKALNAVAIGDSVKSKSPTSIKRTLPAGSILQQISKQKPLPPSKTQLELLEEEIKELVPTNNKNNNMPEQEHTEQNPLKIGPFNFYKGIAFVANKLVGFISEVRDNFVISGENQALILKEVRSLTPRAIELEVLTARFNSARNQIEEQDAEIQLLKEQNQVLKDKIKKIVDTEGLFKVEQAYKDLVLAMAGGKSAADVLREKEEVVGKMVDELKVMVYEGTEIEQTENTIS